MTEISSTVASLVDPLQDIDDHQRAVVARVLAEESALREHLVVYLSGSHAYGFPSHNSDYDLKAAHVAPTRDLLGLSPTTPAANRLEIIDGVEIDYTSNEIQGVLVGCLKGNGNYLERILGSRIVVASEDLVTLRPIVRRNLSRKVENHYVGFARNQLQAVTNARAPTAKKVLYVLRTSLTGRHLLETGELVIDLRRLLRPYGFEAAEELIERKLENETLPLETGEVAHWCAEAERAIESVKLAVPDSVLPAEPPAVAEIEQWLLAVRERQLA